MTRIAGLRIYCTRTIKPGAETQGTSDPARGDNQLSKHRATRPRDSNVTSSALGRPLMTTENVADHYGFSKWQIGVFVRSGRLAVIELTPGGPWRFRPEDVEDFIQRSRSVGPRG